MVLTYVVGPEDAGAKVHTVLRQRLLLSRRMIIALKRQPLGVTLNGRHARVVDLVREGDVVAADLPSFLGDLIPSAEWLEPVYENEHVSVYDKPAGMAVHPSKKHFGGTLGNIHAARMSALGADTVFRPLGRLDRDTSGLVLTARNMHAAAVLKGRIDKVYYAVAEGVFGQTEGTVDAPLEREHPDARRRVVREDGKPAVTHYRVLRQAGDCALLRLVLETGRTHQIRVHMAHLGHPLSGDALYGGRDNAARRHLLHCGEMTITPPGSPPVTVRAGLPREFLDRLAEGGAGDGSCPPGPAADL